jgi:hypothetical protein
MRVLVVERVFSTVEEEFQMRIVHQLLALLSAIDRHGRSLTAVVALPRRRMLSY